ncbi:UNVERIFIED_CONTAM: hypothetical protein PYX00_004381 [Menopon gallinae]|uniref:Zinc finger CCHC domain-containing protein 4 n=1 Tax=Menopon gallinae TaxID=328185 RepID=A0AAW2I3Z1_9NEOP
MNVDVILDDLDNNPQCLHGPCLLFKTNGPKAKEYYACSASRDHKECPFYVDATDKNLKKLKKVSKWVAIRSETIQNIISKNPYKKYLKFLKLMKTCKNENKCGERRKAEKCNQKLSVGYCYTCEELFESSDSDKHKDCKTIQNLTEYDLRHPTEILTPKEDSKTHAQYFFTNDTVKNIVLVLSRLGMERILCIGAPRIHEYVLNECKDEFQSMLLDIDLKYYNFYSEKEFIWYNMFNNCVLKEGCLKNLEEFLSHEKVAVVMDPPFGGRVEPLAFTVNELIRLYNRKNRMNENDGEGLEKSLGILWIFPYFMEVHIKASLPDFRMFDLKIDYDNHSSFTNVGNRKRKFGSPVRIFTNIPLSQLNLEGISGYRFCGSCGYWVAEENKHCDDCDACTSKNGRTYIHCYLCSRCVKPSYVHCRTCNKCILPDHTCSKPEKELSCFHCKGLGHKKRDCPEAQEMLTENRRKRRKKKRN